MKIITDKQKIAAIQNYFSGRFGISEKYFQKYIFIEHWEKVFMLTNTSAYSTLDRPKLYGAGQLLLADFDMRVPANLAMTCFRKKDLSKNFVELPRQQVRELYEGKEVTVSIKNLEPGLILVCLNGRVAVSAWLEGNKLKLNSGQEKEK